MVIPVINILVVLTADLAVTIAAGLTARPYHRSRIAGSVRGGLVLKRNRQSCELAICSAGILNEYGFVDYMAFIKRLLNR